MSNFKPYEASDFKCKCGCDTNNISPAVVNTLNELYAKLNKYISITSGYRCPNHPESIKNPNSSHIGGIACDIIADSSRDRFLVVRTLLELGIKRIGISGKKHFIHFDLDTAKSQEVLWIY